MSEADEAITKAMTMLGQLPNTIFIGQNVAYDGNVVYKHLAGVPMEKRLELPVAEEMQMGMSIGLALQGYLPISIYPRIDFMLLAMNQLVGHLDKLPILSDGGYKPKVIIRTRVGSKTPLNAGPQHTQDYTEAFRLMLTTVIVTKVTKPEEVMPAYEDALKRELSTIVIEALA